MRIVNFFSVFVKKYPKVPAVFFPSWWQPNYIYQRKLFPSCFVNLMNCMEILSGWIFMNLQVTISFWYLWTVFRPHQVVRAPRWKFKLAIFFIEDSFWNSVSSCSRLWRKDSLIVKESETCEKHSRRSNQTFSCEINGDRSTKIMECQKLGFSGCTNLI